MILLETRVAKRFLIGLVASVLFIFLCECIVRKKFSYIQQHSEASSLIINNTPEHIITVTSKGRRLRANADIVVKNHYLSKRDIRITTNAMGFRDDELSPTKEQNEIRILVLGDSITMADYLQREETFVERTEHYLNKFTHRYKFQVINSGVTDIGIREEMEIYEEKGRLIRPDIVVLAFYLNDSRPPFGYVNEAGHRGWWRRNFVMIDELYKLSVLDSWVSGKEEHRFLWIEGLKHLNWQKDRKQFLDLVSLAKYDWGTAWNRESWKIIEKNVSRLSEYARKDRFQLVWLNFPVSFQVKADFLEDRPQQYAKVLAEKYNIPFLDLLPLFRENKEMHLFFDHCHPTAFGNQLVGIQLAAFLQKNFFRP